MMRFVLGTCFLYFDRGAKIPSITINISIANFLSIKPQFLRLIFQYRFKLVFLCVGIKFVSDRNIISCVYMVIFSGVTVLVLLLNENVTCPSSHLFSVSNGTQLNVSCTRFCTALLQTQIFYLKTLTILLACSHLLHTLSSVSTKMYCLPQKLEYLKNN